MLRHLALVPMAVGGLVGAVEVRPNVLVIVADGPDRGVLRVPGSATTGVANLDALAASGLSLERFHVCPTGAPTMAGLLTGRYHYRTGVSGDSRGEGMMHSHEITIAGRFRDAGYATGCFGKWLNGANWPHHPTARGFDVFVGTCGEPPHVIGTPDLASNGAATSGAIAFMGGQADAGRPFFCLVSFHATNVETEEPEGQSRDPKTVAADRPVGSIDTHAGRLIEWLEMRQLRDRTIIWFLSSHGPDITQNEDNPDFNSHLRGGKGSVHEGGVRVPSFVSWPGRIPADSKFRRLTANLDILPTLLDLCGISPTGDIWIDGLSLAPVLKSGGQIRRWPNRLLFNSWTPPGYDVKNASVAVRTDRWVALRDPRWRRGRASDDHSGWELYDLNADPHQSTDLADDYPFLLSDMRADFSRWMDETTDDGLEPIPTEIGHAEWPVVTLTSGDSVPVRDGGPGGAAAFRWPVEMVGGGGRFTVEIDCAPPGDAVPRAMRLSLGDSHLDFTVGRSTSGKGLTIGEMALPPGKGDLTLQPLESDSPGIDFRILRIKRIDSPQNPALRD